ncbi:glycerophosphoryl diester phosphodiesterase membrane domain-containing protein [Sphingomonas daechungensis]|uniref:glycerophosphoryl diester phosphodiesterase membrane domain-containing protein n=1 Tax=Sphingomonas daechungensis TaxID=1176646 RepID=UPI0037836ADB
MTSKLSISRAWDETRALLQSDGKLFATVALALLVLPGLVANLFMPTPKVGEFPAPGAWVAVFLVAMLIAIVGQLALAKLAMGNRLTVGEVITSSFARMPVYFISQMIWGLPFAILFVGIGRTLQAQPGGALALLFLVVLVAFFFVVIRMVLTGPIAVAEQIGPVEIVKRSWNLTAGNWWRLFAFLMIFLIGAAILILATFSILGLVVRMVFGEMEPFTVGALLVSLAGEIVQAGVYVVLMVMLARLYVQASGREAQASVPSSGI